MSLTQNSSTCLPVLVNNEYGFDTREFGYSVAASAPDAARLAYISGQSGQDSAGAFSPRFEDQVTQTYENLKHVLDMLGAAPEQVVKLTVYVVGHDQTKLPILSAATKRVFDTQLPAQTLVLVPCLALEQMQFEVDAVVARFERL